MFSHSGKPMGIVITAADYRVPKTSSWTENYTEFGQLILSKIIKIVATSCQIFKAKMYQIPFWLGGSTPDPAVVPDP